LSDSDVTRPGGAAHELAPGLLDALDAASIGVALAAPGGRLLRANRALGRLVGRDRTELLTLTLAGLTYPDDRHFDAEALQQFRDGVAEPDVAELRLIHADGGFRWVRRELTPIRDETGALHVALHAINISERVVAAATLHQSELWYRSLAQYTSDLVLVVGFDDGIHYASPSAEALLGFHPLELLGRRGVDVIHPDDYEHAVEAVTAPLDQTSRRAGPVELRARRADGSWVWFEVAANRLPPEIAPDWFVLNARDISERKEHEGRQAEFEAHFQNAFAQSPLGIVFTDLAGRVVWANAAFARLFAASSEEPTDVDFALAWAADEMEREQALARQLLRGDIESFQFERRFAHSDGRTQWGRAYISLVRDELGEPRWFLGQLEDITDHKHRELALEHDAEHEPLTGLWNRSGFCRLLETAWDQRLGDGTLAVLFVDLDDFKRANDEHGHGVGDDILVHVGQRLRTVVRGGDVVARWGGDEFVVMCPEIDGAREAEEVASRLCVTISVPFRVVAGEVRIGASIGVAIDEGHVDPGALVRSADAASYLAKQRGRGRVEHARPPGFGHA